jgi:hypothetical protein
MSWTFWAKVRSGEYPAEFEDFVDHRTVFALQISRDDWGGGLVRARFVVHAQHTVGIGRCGAERRAVQAGQGKSDAAAAEADTV